MCGRFTLTTPADAIADLFALAVVPELSPRYNIAPSQPVAAVRERDGERRLDLLRWGLVPSWAKDPAIGNRMINARAETVADKPAFRAAFRERRCLIPATGFYEWKRTEATKQPYLVTAAGDGLLALAGLWELWKVPDGGRLETCTIITTSANDLVAPIHDRMPVILERHDFDLWLTPTTESDRLLQLLRSCDSSALAARPVSTYVNTPRNDDPRCIEPPGTSTGQP